MLLYPTDFASFYDRVIVEKHLCESYINYLKLRLHSSRKVNFLQKNEVELNAWKDSLKSDHSQTTWFFIWHLVFAKMCDDFHYLLLKNQAFSRKDPEKTENIFRIFSIYNSLIVHLKILCGPSFYIFSSFLFETACQDTSHERTLLFN